MGFEFGSGGRRTPIRRQVPTLGVGSFSRFSACSASSGFNISSEELLVDAARASGGPLVPAKPEALATISNKLHVMTAEVVTVLLKIPGRCALREHTSLPPTRPL